MNIEPGVHYPTKLLVAVSAFSFGSTVVECTDGPIANELVYVSPDAEELGLSSPGSHGLWVWEGEVSYDPDAVPTFIGTWRRVTADEATKYAEGLALWWKPESA